MRPRTAVPVLLVAIAMLLAALLPSAALAAGPAWSELPGATTAGFCLGVDLYGSSWGWTVGEGGVVMATTDAGASWSARSVGVTDTLRGVSFVNTQQGWVVGGSDAAYFTRDGGATWVAHHTGSQYGLNDVVAVDAKLAWVVAYRAIYKTADTGATWTLQATPQADLSAVDFVGPTNGWAVGSGGTIVATTDGGATWTAQDSGGTQNLSAVDFVDTLHGWAVGASGTILATSDGGATWTAQDSGFGPGESIRGVAFVDAQRGWAAGPARIIATTDGGAHWSVQAEVMGVDFSGIDFRDATHGLASALAISAGGGRVYATHTGGWPENAITSPTASSTWPTNSAQTVSWTLASAVSGGEFRVWLVKGSGWYIGKQVPGVWGQTDYSTSVTVPYNVPPGTDCKVYVYWRPVAGVGPWLIQTRSAAFTVEEGLPRITVTAPTSGSAWDTPSTQTVSWTLSGAVSVGQFRVWLVSPTDGWYIGKWVTPVRGQTVYDISVSVPGGLAMGPGYKVYVYWRSTVGSGDWESKARSAAFVIGSS